MGLKDLNLSITLAHEGYSATFDLEVLIRLAITVVTNVPIMIISENWVEISGIWIPKIL
jgi:hypothetical protein